MTPNGKLRTFREAVAVVTGAASGIGRALAQALARQGARVVLADRQADLAREVVEAMQTRWRTVTAEELDVRDFSAVQRLLQQTQRAYGRLDYLFNNAGIVLGGEVVLHDMADWDGILDVNLRGVVHGVQAAYPIMIGQGFGHIVNTASILGLVPVPGLVGYCTSKHAVIGLSLSLRMEAARHGVRVSVLCPGLIRTAMLAEGGRFGKILRQTPQRHIEPSRVLPAPMDAGIFAQKALQAVAKNRPMVIIPWWWKILWRLYRGVPNRTLWRLQHIYEGRKRKAPEDTTMRRSA